MPKFDGSEIVNLKSISYYCEVYSICLFILKVLELVESSSDG